MFKKLLVLPILFFSLSVLYAQQLPLETSDNTAKNSTNLTLKRTSENYEKYFATKDINKKGSGYKPFKRWEYHWNQYLQEDGTIAPVDHLWKAWEQKQQMSKSAKVTVTSNWTSKGPFSQSSNSGQGRVNTVVVDPNNANTIYAGAPAGGLWKSTDAGVNWTPLTDHLPQIGVSGIAIDPNNSQIIYISTGDDDAGDSYSVGVLKSIDGGSTWNQTGNIAGNPIASNEILIDPSNSNTVWVATGNGLFRSTDAGTNWVSQLSGNVRDFKLKPGDPTTVYAVTGNRFYVSTAGGAFTFIATGLPTFGTIGRLRVEVTPAAPNNVYVLAARTNWAFEGVYKSDDSGISFTKTLETSDIFGGSTQAWYDLAFSVSNTDANTMFVGVLDIWKSTNEGDSFTQINDWRTVNSTFTHADIHFMRYYNGVLYAGTDGGVYKSTNNGTSFSDLTKDMSISQFYKVSVSRQTSGKLAGGLQDNGGFSLTNNNWHNYHGGDGMDAASIPSDENTFYGFTQFGGFLTVTNDAGLTSTTISQGPVSGNWVTPLVSNKASEIYSGYNQLYKLENNAGWSQISNHGFGGNLEALEIDPSNPNIIFVTRNRNLYRSTDKGVTFSTISIIQTGFSGVNISSVEVHNTDSNIVWATTTGVSNISGPSSGHTGGGVYKSTDGGITFTDITDNLPNVSKFVVRHHIGSPNNSIYVGTALGVYYRDDATNTWEPFSTNLPNVAVPDLEINPYDATITAATYGRSVWQSSIPSFAFNDLDLTKISSPDNNDVACGAISPSLNVLNNGLNTITSFTVNYNIDGGANQVFNWTGSLASNTSTIVSLPGVSSLTVGEHTLNADVTTSNDDNLFNNSTSSTFSINESGVGQSINPFDDVNTDQWIAHDLWQIGTPTTTDFNNVVTSGYVTNPSGNYSDNTVAYLYSPCYNLAMLENPVLKFKMVFDIEINWDVLYMEYSLDGATWQVLGTAADPNWYNSSFIDPGRILTIGKQWTGKDTTLKEYSYDLASFTSEPSIIFRFKFATDQNTNEEGVVIDDFVIDATAVLAVNDFDKDAFSIYPNPSSDIFNIRRINGNGEEMNVEVYDVTGKLIRKHNDITDNDYKLNMIGVSKGIYFMRIQIDNKQLVKKLILN